VRKKLEELSKDELQFNDSGLIWPLSGSHTITATFHDPDYPFRYLFEHPAIDLRASFNTPLKASGSGYVARVNINGSSYGYIMIVHGDGLSTVYGHVNQSYVSEDEYVIQGQTIGLSGGLPGTRGAGYLTTGPHLHFEVRKNGIPVNPLEYLSNDYYILD
jgi:murein DD-endopeptidase MepM/ murein hydrolase activator NlpD